MPVRTPMAPAAISPMRAVPASIVRPHYVNSSGPADFDDASVKDAATIERMRVAGRIAAAALVEVGRHVHPGVTTDELDAIGHEFVISRGAYPSTLGYKGSPKSLCTSVNDVICHGIPDARPLADGDIVKIDITAFIGGVDWVMWDDRWTVLTADGSCVAQLEDTLAVTDGGGEILTLPTPVADA